MKLLDIIWENTSSSEVSENIGLVRNTFKNMTKGLVRLTFSELRTFDSVLAKDLKAVFNSRTISGVKNLDDLVVQISKGTLSAKGAGDLAVGILKTKGVSGTQIRQIAGQWVENPNFIKAWASKGKNPTVKELMASGKGYTEEAAREIVASCKKSKKFQDAIKAGASTTKTAAAGSKTAATAGASTTKSRLSQLYQNVKQAAKPGNLVKGTGKVIKVVRGGLRSLGILKLVTYFAVFGIGGMVIYDLWNKFFGNNDNAPSEDDVLSMEDWVKCILTPLQDDEDAEIVDGGDEVGLKYNISELGGEETGGHVIFYSDKTVKSANGKTGTWSCNQEGLLNEQSGGSELTARQISSVIDDLEDQLNGDFFESDSTDMLDALSILKSVVGKTYKGRDAIQVIKATYSKVVGMSLTDHVNELTNLDFEALEAKEEIMSIIGGTMPRQTGSGDSDGGGVVQTGGDGNPNTGLSHLTITWDSTDGGEEGGEGGGGAVGVIKYKPCSDFPFEMGCINDKIKELQGCLNKQGSVLKIDGYYGPKTNKDLSDMEFFADGNANDTTITKQMFDKFMEKCKEDRPVVTPVTDLKSKGLTPIPIPKLDSQGMIDTHGVEKLQAQIRKTIDGQKIEQIINDKIKFTRGRYILDMDDELTEDQLNAINRYMAGKGFSLTKKKETLDDARYVWVADSKEARREARKEKRDGRRQDRIDRRVDRLQNRIDNLQSDEN